MKSFLDVEAKHSFFLEQEFFSWHKITPPPFLDEDKMFCCKKKDIDVTFYR